MLPPPAPAPRSALLLLLLLLPPPAIAWPPRGTALAPASDPDGAGEREHLPAPAPRPAPALRTLAPRLQLESDGRVHLRLSGPPSGPAALQLHLRERAARGRRGARGRDDCPLGPGRCCRLHTVRASLEDLGWTDWVLSPRELQVRLCAGECPGRYRAASTHAQVKARLHGLRPEAVPAPCCVPSGYDLLVLLHKTDGGVALRTYDDLQAKGCHCA